MDWVWVLFVTVRAVVVPEERWTPVLVHLDRERADAFAAGDPAGLAGVYVDGSPLLEDDERVIEDYARRGGRVVGAELELLSCRAVSVTSKVVVLDVVDRLGDAEVAWDDGSFTHLPHDRATQRTVTLRRTGEGWRVATVSAERRRSSTRDPGRRT